MRKYLYVLIALAIIGLVTASFEERTIASNNGRQYRANSYHVNCYGFDWGWKKLGSIPELDPSSVVYVQSPPTQDQYSKNYDGNYLKDKHAVYLINDSCRAEIINGANPATFESLGWSYTRDATNIYWRGKKIFAHPDTFKSLGRGYAKDREVVFYEGEQIGADPNSFQLIAIDQISYSGDIARDKNCYFLDGEKARVQVGIEPAKFICENPSKFDNICRNVESLENCRHELGLLVDRYNQELRH